MIISIGLNLCIDTVIRVESIKSGHFDVKPQYLPGGTALNVVLVSKRLKKAGKIDKAVKVYYAGFMDKGRPYKLFLKKKISTKYCIFINEEIRTNYSIVPTSGDEMHLKSDGPRISKMEYEKFENLFDEIVKVSNVIILSGKLPKETDNDYYNKLIEKANSSDIFTAVDTRGETLKQAVNSSPFFVKCNFPELAYLLNIDRINSMSEILDAEYVSIKNNIPLAVISGGKNGIFVFYKGKFMAQYKLSDEIITKSTTGAGDIVLAFFSILLDCVKRGTKKLNRETIQEYAIYSTAFSSASTLTSYPSVFNTKTAEKLLRKVIVENNLKKIILY